MDAKRFTLREPDVSSDRIRYGSYQFRHQPRNPQTYAALVESVRQYGILTKLWIQEDSEDSSWFDLIAGAGRLQAAIELGLPTVPCLVFPAGLNRPGCLRLAVTENVIREQLSLWDKADAIQELAEIENISISRAAREFGISQAQASKLTNARAMLAPDIQQGMLEHGYGSRFADYLHKLPTHDAQREVFGQLMREKWTADRLGREVRQRRGVPPARDYVLKAVIAYLKRLRLDPADPTLELSSHLSKLKKLLERFRRQDLPWDQFDEFLNTELPQPPEKPQGDSDHSNP